MTLTKPRLISFSLCPYVQRSVITLLEKKIDFSIEYIDLHNKPDWFLKLSPLGKVPVLVLDHTVLFESAVINEYLDETSPPSLHPADTLEKAFHRAYTELGSALLVDQYHYSLSLSDELRKPHLDSLQNKMSRLEEVVKTPFFSGSEFRLVDSSLAPLFFRLDLLNQKYPQDKLFSGFPKLSTYTQNLVARESVQKSVRSDFQKEYWEYLEHYGKR